MATPLESITTFSGRRCTRSQARTAATSILPETTLSISTEPDFTTSTPDTQVAATSEAVLPDITTSETSSSAPSLPGDTSASSTAESVASIEDDATLTSAAADLNSSTSLLEVVTTTFPSSIDPTLTTTLSSVPSSSLPVTPIESSREPDPKPPANLEPTPQPDGNATPTATDSAGGSPAGLIAPDDPGPKLTFSNSNVGPIVGGVVGGVVAIVLISALLFFFLKRRRAREPFAQWRQRFSEKDQDPPGFLANLKSFDVKNIPAIFGSFIGKTTGRRTGPAQNPYYRHSVQSSSSSIYSTQPNRRSQSISEPPWKFRQQLRGLGDRFGERMPSLKKSRSLLQKKPDSLVIGSQSPFAGIVENPVVRFSGSREDPFADPQPLDPPRTLHVLNPDPKSQESTPRLEQGLSAFQQETHLPLAPQAVAHPNETSKDRLTALLDEIEEKRGSSTPEWLRDAAHRRTHSATTALRSHPPSAYTASIYTTPNTPKSNSPDAPPVPQQPLPPDKSNAANAYDTSSIPAFNARSRTPSHASSASFHFGGPGYSRPATAMFSEVSVASATPRVGRQSDPFDLDRPEVLGFGRVGGRSVRASVTRQNSKTRRMSTVPNWVGMADGPYERASAVPGPLNPPGSRG